MAETPLLKPHRDQRIGYDRRNLPDLERLDEKLDRLDEIPPAAFVGEPRAIRQSEKKVWWKTLFVTTEIDAITDPANGDLLYKAPPA